MISVRWEVGQDLGFEIDTSSMTLVREFVGQIISCLFNKGFPFFFTSSTVPKLGPRLDELQGLEAAGNKIQDKWYMFT